MSEAITDAESSTLPLTFATMLDLCGLDRRHTRLLRHQDRRYPGNPSPFVLWRDHSDRFNAYQSTQAFSDAAKLRAPYWASFVGLPENQTMFVGIYASELIGPLLHDRPHPVDGTPEAAGSCNEYELTLTPHLNEYIGKLLIRWGKGYRAWIQRGDGTPKPVAEIKASFSEPEFPGFSRLITRLSKIESLPSSWLTPLSSTKGIYLLVSQKTREQYVGMASGQQGFLGRWREYAVTGHGGNIALKSRDPEDYQISILETVGSIATAEEIGLLERVWKDKLRSVEMGLNRNR